MIHSWDFKNKRVERTMYLDEVGLVPLEVRFHHDPDSSHGFVGAALSFNIIDWCKRGGQWIWEKVIDVENVRHPEWPIPLPGLISVILISMDDRFLYFCNRLHRDIRPYRRPGLWPERAAVTGSGSRRRDQRVAPGLLAAGRSSRAVAPLRVRRPRTVGGRPGATQGRMRRCTPGRWPGPTMQR